MTMADINKGGYVLGWQTYLSARSSYMQVMYNTLTIFYTLKSSYLQFELEQKQVSEFSVYTCQSNFESGKQLSSKSYRRCMFQNAKR